MSLLSFSERKLMLMKKNSDNESATPKRIGKYHELYAKKITFFIAFRDRIQTGANIQNN